MHKWMPLNSYWLVLRIGGIDFLHCWLVDSTWLECAETLIGASLSEPDTSKRSVR